MNELAGKDALITRAGRGFGLAIAERFAQAGAELATNYRGSRKGCEAIAARLTREGRRSVIVRADLIDGDVIARMAQGGPGGLRPARHPRQQGRHPLSQALRRIAGGEVAERGRGKHL